MVKLFQKLLSTLSMSTTIKPISTNRVSSKHFSLKVYKFSSKHNVKNFIKQNNFSTSTINDWFNSIITIANNTGVGSLETQSLLFISIISSKTWGHRCCQVLIQWPLLSRRNPWTSKYFSRSWSNNFDSWPFEIITNIITTSRNIDAVKSFITQSTNHHSSRCFKYIRGW